MLHLPKLIVPLFVAAGWKRSSNYAADAAAPIAAHDAASSIIEEFRGLKVGASCAGTEQAASDVHFYAAVRPESSGWLLPWRRTVGEIAAFASAHNDHMILFASSNGRLYVFTDPDERLYDGGTEFGELMRRLLWGYKFGPEVPRDA